MYVVLFIWYKRKLNFTLYLFDNAQVTDEFGVTQMLNNFLTGVATELEADIPPKVTSLLLVSSSVLTLPMQLKPACILQWKLSNIKVNIILFINRYKDFI